MLKGIHHVGLAVRSVDEMVQFMQELFGATVTDYRMETPEFFSRMIAVGSGLFEILEPRGEGGLIERFLDKRGEGIHHVSMVVEDVSEVLAFCKEKNITVIGDRFIHPKSAHGVQIELLDARELQGADRR
jgi:methylmalonyl-CoA epimerase